MSHGHPAPPNRSDLPGRRHEGGRSRPAVEGQSLISTSVTYLYLDEGLKIRVSVVRFRPWPSSNQLLDQEGTERKVSNKGRTSRFTDAARIAYE
jgi:hypothetical protein